MSDPVRDFDPTALVRDMAAAGASPGPPGVGPAAAEYRRTGTGLDRVERALLGSIIVDRSLRLLCDGLEPRHFSSALRGQVFAVAMEVRRLDAILLHAELDRRGVKAPAGYPGWGTVLSELLDDACVDDDAVRDYVRTIREAYARRLVFGGKP